MVADEDTVESQRSEAASGEEEAGGEQGRIVDSGFGQEGQYVQAVTLVENTSDHGGQTVTVSVNFLDESGATVATESQVDSFNFPGQTAAVTVFADVTDPKLNIASIEPTLLIEDDGTFSETEVDFGSAPAEVVDDGYGGLSAKVPVENPTSEAIQSPDIGVACRNAAGDIIGGGFTFPDLVPPNGSVVADVDLVTSGKPEECTGYVQGPIY